MEQHLDANGIRYSHIVNPNTGVGLTHHITVTIVARHGIEADGVTKVVSILGETRGLAYVNKRPGLASLIVTSEGSRSHIAESNLFASLTAVPALAALNK
jgi:thiamine biosynthesis lipoprotein